jgi:hypothetical protein
MKAIKYEYTYRGREFICKVVPDPVFHASSASVRIYEKKKFLFFNKVWLDTKGFWVYKYATLEDGVKTVLSNYLKDEEEREEVQKKWETALDKS